MNKTLAYLAHYFRAAGAAAWNGGILALKLFGGYTGLQQAAPGLGLPTANAHVLLGLFLAAAFWAGVDWMAANPLPVIAPQQRPVISPAAVAMVAWVVLCLGMSGCAGIAGASADINKVIDSLPAGSVGAVTVEHHDIYGSGGVVLLNAVKGTNNSASVASIDWHESYPAYQPHVNITNYVRLGKDGQPPPAPTSAPVLVQVPLTANLVQAQANIPSTQDPAPAK